MTFLSAIGGNVVPVLVDETPEPGPEPEKPAPRKRAPRKKKVAEETPKAEETKITLEDIRTLTSKKAKEHREAIKAKLTEWGAANVVKIAEDKYPEFVEFLNSL